MAGDFLPPAFLKEKPGTILLPPPGLSYDDDQAFEGTRDTCGAGVSLTVFNGIQDPSDQAQALLQGYNVRQFQHAAYERGHPERHEFPTNQHRSDIDPEDALVVAFTDSGLEDAMQT